VRWEYEPHTFVLERDGRGRPTRAFTPDFYLPDYGVYLEVTTLRQSLVTAKRRKIRRLGELNPGVQVLLVDRQTYFRVLERFGLVAA
jgi:hypothetical protein